MPHFFITNDTIKNDTITITDKENYNHIARALHMKKGEKLLLADENKIEYETIIDEINQNQIIAKIEKTYPSKRILPLNLFLAQVVLKKEAQSEVIKKAGELGIKGIYPLVSDNCTIKKSYITEKLDKYNKLSYEASKQCERPDIAKVYEVCELEEILKSTNFDIKIICVEKYAQTTLKKYLSKITPVKNAKILLIIGPEGGFSEREFELMKQSKLPMVSLGNLILRADTAVVAAIANTIYGLCDE